MNNGELVHEIERDGFVIRLYLEPETDAPDWDFESEEDRQETLRKIDQGIYLWFCAHVVALKSGIELGHDYLGGCCYDSVKQFIEEGEYFDDMVNEAVDQARETLKRLAA